MQLIKAYTFSGSIIKRNISFKKQHILSQKNIHIYYGDLEKNKKNSLIIEKYTHMNKHRLEQ